METVETKQLEIPQEVFDYLKDKPQQEILNDWFLYLNRKQSDIGLPHECYKYPPIESKISAESDEYFTFESLSWENQVEMAVKGFQFPMKGFVKPKILKDINVVKAIFLSVVRTLSIKPFAVALFFSRNRLNELVENLLRPCDYAMSNWILKDKHVSVFAQNFQYLVFVFLLTLGIKETNADKLAEIVSHLVEYDNAYRLRLVDILSEVNQEQLANKPRKEVKRLFKLALERDTEPMGRKIKGIYKILRFALYLPSVVDALFMAVKTSDWTKLVYDDSDRYFACMRNDYKFMGMTKSQRDEYAKGRGWTYGERIKE